MGTVSPLLHGEVNCIQRFFTVTFPKPKCRPDPANDTIFLSTHEPCGMCLSAIAWSGFSEFYYLFTHQETRDLFGFDILEQVFRVQGHDTAEDMAERELYNRENHLFSGRSIVGLVEGVENGTEKETLRERVQEIKDLYNQLQQEWLNVTQGHST